MSGPSCCLLELQLRQGRGSLLSCEHGFGLFHKFRMESDENRNSYIRDSIFDGRFPWIQNQWKRRESVYCDWRRWHRWPHQEILPPWSPYRHQDPPIATILTPRDEPPAGREPPPRGFYRLGQVSPKNDNLGLSQPCAAHILVGGFWGKWEGGRGGRDRQSAVQSEADIM